MCGSYSTSDYITAVCAHGNYRAQPQAKMIAIFGQVSIAIGFVIVIARVPGIYGSKRTESEGEARGQGLFTLP